MKAPNVLSLITMLLVVLPSVALAISQQFPEAEYWWAALVTAVIGGLVKGLQVWLGQKTAPPAGLALDAAPERQASPVQRWLAD